MATAAEDGVNTTSRQARRTQPARQRIYMRLHTRVDRLEDAVSHFYKVINELRERFDAGEEVKRFSQR